MKSGYRRSRRLQKRYRRHRSFLPWSGRLRERQAEREEREMAGDEDGKEEDGLER